MDATVGGDQSRDTYLDRIKEHFDERNNSGIERTNRSLHSRWSTYNKDCQRWAAAMKSVDNINPNGTNDRDRLTIAQNLFRGEEKKNKKGKIKKGRAFVLAHCYEVLKDVEKWKPREDQEKRNGTIDLDYDDEEGASSDDGKRSPTPNSVAYSKPKRPNESKKEAKEKKKKKKRGDDELLKSMDALVNARKEATDVRRMARSQDEAAEERR